MKKTVLWISIGFCADPDPGSQTLRIYAHPDPGQTLESQNVEFFH
jgi:hypothetical protein